LRCASAGAGKTLIGLVTVGAAEIDKEFIAEIPSKGALEADLCAAEVFAG